MIDWPFCGLDKCDLLPPYMHSFLYSIQLRERKIECIYNQAMEKIDIVAVAVHFIKSYVFN